jgi:hypothetical protein
LLALLLPLLPPVSLPKLLSPASLQDCGSTGAGNAASAAANASAFATAASAAATAASADEARPILSAPVCRRNGAGGDDSSGASKGLLVRRADGLLLLLCSRA